MNIQLREKIQFEQTPIDVWRWENSNGALMFCGMKCYFTLQDNWNDFSGKN